MPADGPPEGWRPSLADDRAFTATASFTQQDVNYGTVWYHHFGSGSSSDSFQFQVGADRCSSFHLNECSFVSEPVSVLMENVPAALV